MDVGHGYATWLGPQTKFNELPPRNRQWWHQAVVNKTLGPRGETPMHWALSSGDIKRSKAWIKSGGKFEPDHFGLRPVHWLMSRGRNGLIRAVLNDPELYQTLAPEWTILDSKGRDALGILILMREYNDAADLLDKQNQSLVHIGLGESVSLCDALLAQEASLNTFYGKRLEQCIGKHNIPGPSPQMPLIFKNSFWTDELWALAFKKFVTPALKAWDEQRYMHEEFEQKKYISDIKRL